MNAKAQLAARSRARKDKELPPPFQNPFGTGSSQSTTRTAACGSWSAASIRSGRPRNTAPSTCSRCSIWTCGSASEAGDRKHACSPARPQRPAGAAAAGAEGRYRHICFGGKAHLRRRNEAKTPKEVEAWRKEWHDLRRRELTLVGRKDSKCGNWMARYDIATHQLSYKSIRGRQVVIDGVHFPHGQQLVEAAVAAHDIAIRNKSCRSTNKLRAGSRALSPGRSETAAMPFW